jgi:penicillin-binding protein 1A
MTKMHEGLEEKNFEKPEGIIRVAIDKESGKLPTELSSKDPRGSTVRNYYFIAGTQPTEYDDVHVEAVICAESGKLATEYCPGDVIGNQVFIKRPIPYNPEEHGGYIPTDYQYEVPKEYCDIHTSNFNTNTPIENLPIGTIVLPNGTRIYPDGTKLLIDGTIVYPDGTVKSPLDNTNINKNPETNNPNSNDDVVDSDDDSLIDSND